MNDICIFIAPKDQNQDRWTSVQTFQTFTNLFVKGPMNGLATSWTIAFEENNHPTSLFSLMMAACSGTMGNPALVT